MVLDGLWHPLARTALALLYSYPSLWKVVECIAGDIFEGSTPEALAQRRKDFELLSLIFKGGKNSSTSLHNVEDVYIGNKKDGSKNLMLRVYIPQQRDEKKLPVILFAHSGGWAIGSVEASDKLCQQMAYYTNCIVISVEYRLAPEYPYPAALQDMLQALEWVHSPECIAKFNTNDDNVFLAGDSAGGNLVSALCLQVRDDDEWLHLKVKGQILFYPVLNFEFQAESYKKYRTGYVTTAASIKVYWKNYLHSAEVMKSHDTGMHPYQSPLQARSFKGLPPVLMITGEYDPLIDDCTAFVSKLKAADVPVKHLNFSTMHGFMSLGLYCEHFLPSMESIDKFISENKK